MKHISVILMAAALMLAGCGDNDSSSGGVSSKGEDSAVSAEESTPESKAAVTYSEGYYRIAANAALDDGAGNALSYDFERIAYGKPDSKGRLCVSIPCQTGVNELGEAQYVYRNYFTGGENEVALMTADEVRQKVVDYALAMSEKPKQTYELSGEYVGEDETRSDCSGLTELAYLQVGIYLEHYADAQANGGDRMQMIFDNLEYKGEKNGTATYAVKDAGAALDTAKLEKGDLLFFICATNSSSDNNLYTDNGIGHVAMYVGDGKMVHFTADYGLTNRPCRVEDLSDYQSRVLKVRRAVRYIF